MKRLAIGEGCLRPFSQDRTVFTSTPRNLAKIDWLTLRIWQVGTDLGFGSAFDRLVSSARGPCSQPVDETVYLSASFSSEGDRLVSSARGPCSRALMRPFVSLSCSREDDKLASKRLGLVPKCCRAGNRSQL